MADKVEWETSHSLPKSYAKLRKVVANFLIRRGFYNHLHTFANLSELLAIAIDNDLSDTPNRVNIKLFKDAFKNGGTRNYVINCQDSFNFEGSFLVVSLGGAQVGSSASQREITSGAIGCFSTREDGINATITQWDAGKYMSVCIREGLGLDNDDVQEVIRAVRSRNKMSHNPMSHQMRINWQLQWNVSSNGRVVTRYSSQKKTAYQTQTTA